MSIWSTKYILGDISSVKAGETSDGVVFGSCGVTAVSIHKMATWMAMTAVKAMKANTVIRIQIGTAQIVKAAYTAE